MEYLSKLFYLTIFCDLDSHWMPYTSGLIKTKQNLINNRQKFMNYGHVTLKIPAPALSLNLCSNEFAQYLDVSSVTQQEI